ncbi:hypothetical protein AN958_12714, partial [Leucoagaricus sp. SymC.cos]
YPTIFLLTLDILPAQASVVPCDHVFSSAKKIVTVHQNWINLELIEALQMLKFSMWYN